MMAGGKGEWNYFTLAHFDGLFLDYINKLNDSLSLSSPHYLPLVLTFIGCQRRLAGEIMWLQIALENNLLSAIKGRRRRDVEDTRAGVYLFTELARDFHQIRIV